MANLTWKNQGLKVVGSTGITDISSYVTSASIQSSITDLDTTGLGATSKTRINGLPNYQLSVAGFVNSTTDGIFGLLMGGTSVTKRFSYQETTARHYTGTYLPSSIQLSGAPDQLQLFSATLLPTGAVTRTSVALT